NQKILVTAGPTREFIDKIRYISNPSTGKMGFAFAIEAWYLGAQIFFIAGPNQLQIPPEFSTKLVTSVNDMSQAVEQIIVEEKPSFAIFSAAVADYQPKEIVDEKIRSGQSEMVIELKPTIKILKLVQTIKSKKNLKIKIIAFKAEYGKTIDEISKIASTYISDGLADFVIANEVGPVKKGFAVDQTKVLIFSSASNPKVIPASKLEIAYDVWNSILNMPFD
ncbi:MAG: bifunctional phosphopantothenoylcysteine decarboxylase/phosphopantothenate--cysteine ligase CoaBC, partial [Chloroflexi bacterium]|nr:bifunctional phosphopantothenoylcysteine decarboxylase/phosphopantothenate--cysteine ligase CoaBC [Chloroflexota bacterium]